MQLQSSIIVLPAAVLGTSAYNKIVIMSQNEHQRRVNTFCAGILDDLTGMECRYTTMNLSAVCFTVTLFSAVVRVGLPSFLMSTAISETKSLNTSLLEVMISSKNEPVFIHDLSDHTLHIIFDAWRASMKVGSKQPIAWNNSRHAQSWRFYFHRRIEETGYPGII
jgi:hypothetical protein